MAQDERDGSALCLACGMCCRGMLHGWAELKSEERESAEAHGLAVFEGSQGLAFNLPCPRLNENACEIYGQRPSTCGGYRCGLLDDYLGERVDLPTAHSVVAEARRMAGDVRALVGDVPFPVLRSRWRRGLANFLSGDPLAAEAEQRAYLLLSALCDFLDRYMMSPREQKLLEASPVLLEKRDSPE